MIGLIDGSAVVRNQDDCRDRLLSLRRAVLQACVIQNGDTDAVTTNTIKKLVIEAESAHRAVKERLTEYGRAPEFFSAANIDRMARWSVSQSGFTIRPSGGGIEFSAAASTTVQMLGAVSLPDLPNIAPSNPAG